MFPRRFLIGDRIPDRSNLQESHLAHRLFLKISVAIAGNKSALCCSTIFPLCFYIFNVTLRRGESPEREENYAPITAELRCRHRKRFTLSRPSSPSSFLGNISKWPSALSLSAQLATRYTVTRILSKAKWYFENSAGRSVFSPFPKATSIYSMSE